jgi:hypothetical protein
MAEHLLALRGSQKSSLASNLHFNAAIAMTSRPCSVILSELCRRVVDDTTSVTSTKRGACIAVHSIYLSTKEDNDAATQDLHEALLSTVVAQLAAPDTGRYQGTVRNIILAAATPRGQPTLRIGNNLAAHFLRLAISTPLPKLPESARQFALSIIASKRR